MKKSKHSERQKAKCVIIRVRNKGKETIKNVELFNSYENRNKKNFGQDKNIEITSNIPGISYEFMLAASESQPYEVGRTVIISKKSGQPEQSIKVMQRMDVGYSLQHYIIPTIDPYQQQTDRIVDDFEYPILGGTRVVITQVLPESTVLIRFYINKRMSLLSRLFSTFYIVSGGNHKRINVVNAEDSIIVNIQNNTQKDINDVSVFDAYNSVYKNIYTCKKDYVMTDGQVCFIKDKEYSGYRQGDGLVINNEENNPHHIDEWRNHFKIKPPSDLSFGQNKDISIRSGLPNMEYSEILDSIINNKIKIGKTMVISQSIGQVEEPFTISHATDTGDMFQEVFTPIIDTYQYQSDRIIEDEEYILDGFTSVILSRLNPWATVTLRLYPVKEEEKKSLVDKIKDKFKESKKVFKIR